MEIIDAIRGWQTKAKSIAPPEGTDILPVRGGLPGPAFFPEGLGLQNSSSDAWPCVMAIGHNFGCDNYRTEIDATGREDNKATWRNLRTLVTQAGVPIETCFMTNWFIGLQPGNKQVGEFHSRRDARFEQECRELLIEQICTLRPKLILLLGLPVVQRSFEIMPSLRPWSHCLNWSDIDTSSLGPVVHGTEVPGTGVSTTVVALLHPSFSGSNQRHRRTVFPVHNPEVEMIRKALAGCAAPATMPEC